MIKELHELSTQQQCGLSEEIEYRDYKSRKEAEREVDMYSFLLESSSRRDVSTFVRYIQRAINASTDGERLGFRDRPEAKTSRASFSRQ
jgi:hypothetical protein